MDFRQFNSSVNDMLHPLDTPFPAGILKLLLVLYGGLVGPHLPDAVLKWFDFAPFRVLVLALIVWTSNHDPAVSILAAVAFMVTLNIASGKKAFDRFGEVRQYDY